MQKQRCKMSDCDPIIRQALNNRGEFSFYPRGKSMEPTICEGRDKVFLTKLPEQIKKNQIILYKRNNGDYVMHRVIKVKKNNYTMCGDNQYLLEKGIKIEQMIGLVYKIERDGTGIDINDERYRPRIGFLLRRNCLGGFFRKIKRLRKQIFRKGK